MEESQIKNQSNSAYKQWCEQWRAHSKEHSKFKMKPLSQFENIGIGKTVVCVANGYSFEEQIETIKNNKDNVDILCCDKTLGNLIENGIFPTYCMVCDANVNYEKYLKPYEDKLKNTVLFINVCANPEWSKNGNWKDIYFFVNQDVIDSHVEFSNISGCQNFIPAGTNVSNAMVILLTQSDNTARRNFFGYDKIALVGFDYSWKANGKYYAFNEDGDGKNQYMKHLYVTTPSGEFAYSSGNLTFSMQWLDQYVKTFNLPVIQTAKDSLLQFGKYSDLEKQMKYSYKKEDGISVRKAINELRKTQQDLIRLQNFIQTIGKNHWLEHAKTI